MKKLKPLFTFIFIIVVFSCETKKQEKDETTMTLKKETISKKLFKPDSVDLKIDSIFKITSKIEIFAYINRGFWEKEDNPNFRNFPILKNNRIIIKEKYIKNKIILINEDVNKLRFGFNKFEGEIVANACYDPRHLIVFYNQNNEIIGYIEFCFDCGNSDFSKSLSFMQNYTNGISQVIKNLGITYFEEDKEFLKNYYKNK